MSPGEPDLACWPTRPWRSANIDRQITLNGLAGRKKGRLTLFSRFKPLYTKPPGAKSLWRATVQLARRPRGMDPAADGLGVWLKPASLS